VKKGKLLQQQFSRALQSTSKLEPSGLFSIILMLCSRRLTIVYSIYKPTKPATQSGEWHGHHWRMDWDILSKGHRWENPLMGWQSSADFVQGTHINFKSKEDAIRFAEKQGYEYFVQEPNKRKIVPKAYANNFLWSDKKLKHIRTK
jgi:NADH dehydrogenase (ubiquinone) Fe-S protein 4